MHRPGNVDKEEKLKELLHTIENNVNNIPVLFPVHPRTANNIPVKKTIITIF